jgi:ribosome-associated protein
MAEDLAVTDAVVIPGAEIELEFARSSGPGGQHVNTTDTRVRLRWLLSKSSVLWASARDRLVEAHPAWITRDGDLVLTSDRYRSRQRNIADATERLADAVRAALVPPKRRVATRPTRSSVARRVDDKKQRGETKRGRGRVHDE